jgi:putative membrane protein insertion efficiency factor
VTQRLSSVPSAAGQAKEDEVSPFFRQAVRDVRAAIVTVLCLSIRVYQWLLSPLLGNCCRFEPSCSRYALLCIERLGPVRGCWLSIRRLSRCHPFCPGGHDPPPEVTS